MRIDLETIKKIEFYLTDNMSSVEKRMFEFEMESNSELKEAVFQQKNLLKAMEKSYIKELAISAGRQYRRIKTLKIGTAILGGAVLLGGIYFGYNYLNKQDHKLNASVEQNDGGFEEPQPQTANTSAKTDTSFSFTDSTQVKAINMNEINSYKKGDNVYQDSLVVFDTQTDSVQNNYIETIQDTRIDTTTIVGDSVNKDYIGKVTNGEIFRKFEKGYQYFTASANKDIKIKGAEGTKVTIPSDALVDKNGFPISGNVTVILKEFYKKSDMVFANLHTQSNGELLESGGMIYISVQQNDEAIKLKKDKKIFIQFTNKVKNDSMLIFNAVYGNEKMDWKLDEYYQTVIDTSYTKDRSITFGNKTFTKTRHVEKMKGNKTKMLINLWNPGFDQLILESGQLGWINCDRFGGYQNKSALRVQYNTGYAPVVRLIFPSINSMMAVYQFTDIESIFQNIPVGMEVDIVAFSMVDDEPYYFTKRITMTADHIELIDLHKTTLDELELEMKRFDLPGNFQKIDIMN